MKTSNALMATAMLATAYADGFGSFAVINRCDFDLYLWSVAGGAAPGNMITLPGGHPEIGYKEVYRETPNQGGVSVKVSPNYAPGNSVPATKISQLEYTVPNQNDPAQASVKDLIFYDLSWVDGNPFDGVAMTMQTSMGGSGDPCPSGTCGLGQACDVGYLWSTDDVKTHACGLSADVIWTFCSAPGGSLQVPKGLLQGRDAAPEPVPEAKAAAEADADPLAVCVDVGGNGIAHLCPDAPAASSTTTASTTPSPSPTPAAPVVALQKPAAPAQPSTTPAAAPAPVSTPQPVSNPAPVSGPVSLVQLTNLAQSGVSTWITYDGAHLRRDITEHSAHRHNHQQFHRRNRIIKAIS